MVVVNIYVKDVNDNMFVFINIMYVVKVYENQFVGSYVMMLLVFDKDFGLGGVFLFLISGQGKDVFDIDLNMGIVMIIKFLD